jgi:L-2-aminoadipate reductase
VSSTSALDTEHYVQLSDSLSNDPSGVRGVPEGDDLEGARYSLKSGYGQSKWVSEKLLFEAGRRGLRGHVVRPGYVVGDSQSAGRLFLGFDYHLSIDGSTAYIVTNTDDFVWRLIKGCIQLGLVPNINNTVNMVPVDHVARCITLAALYPQLNGPLNVLHVSARPRLTFNDMFSSLSRYGYAIEQCEYLIWRSKLERHVMEVQDNALFPLLHFVLDDLPTSTKAPELDDRNMQNLLEPHQLETSMTVTDDMMGRYLAWLVEVEFLPAPVVETERKLPKLDNLSVTRAIGRSGM